jgi:dihydropyrimidinase
VSQLETVIRGALCVLPDGPAVADVGVGGGSIAAIAGAGELDARRVIPAEGMVLIPGAIDPHVHLRTRFGDWVTRDDFWTGTVPAAVGGTTTIIDFAIPVPGETAASAFERCRAEARSSAAVDYALHACVTREAFAASLEELASLRAAGVRSVKVFSAYRSTIGLTLDEIDQVLRRAAELDLLVLVHAEANDVIEAAISEQVAAGRLGPRGHAASRPAHAEAAAIDAISELAAERAARVFFVHVSSADGVEAVRRARRRGRAVNAETCTHYLFLDDSVYDRPDGELWVCSPPIRSRADQRALWSALEDGTLDLVSTDHNCFDRSQKLAHRGDFRLTPNGLPGVELRLPLLLGAIAAERLSWANLARLTSEMPARIFGLWPRKGALAEGSDADLALIDPGGSTDLGATHMATDYSPYAGSAPGVVAGTWVRGRRLFGDGRFAGERGYGAWLEPPVSAPRTVSPAPAR